MSFRPAAVLQLAPPPAPDADLLRSYVLDHDTGAFEELARRYGGLARRVGRDICPAAADDVAQATLVLLRQKAKSLFPRGSVVGWVFETARRLALKTRTSALRRKRHEARAIPPLKQMNPLDEVSFQEVREIVVDEVSRLPNELRNPLVLCFWEGIDQSRAAARLGYSLRTYQRKLAEGRECLTARLVRRGLTGPAVLAALVAVEATGRATGPYVDNRYKIADVSTGAAALVRSANRSTSLGKVVASGLAVALTATGVTFALSTGESQAPVEPPKLVSQGTPNPGYDWLGDTLPPRALARLGSNRFHQGDNMLRVVVSRDGRWIASQGIHSWKLWDAGTGKEFPLAGGKWGDATVLVCEPSGRTLAAVIQDKDGWKLVDAVTGETRLTMPGLHAAVGTIRPGTYSNHPTIRPDGNAVVYAELSFGVRGRKPFAVKSWGVGNDNPKDLFDPGPNRPTRFQFSPDGRRFAVHYEPDYGTDVWDTTGPRLLFRVPDTDRNMSQSFTFSADGKWFAKEDGGLSRVRIWDAESGRESGTIEFEKKDWGHALSFTPDGKSLAVLVNHRTFRIFDIATRKPVREITCLGWQGFDIAFTADGKRIVSAEGDDVFVRDAATGELAVNNGHTYTIYGVTWSRDGTQITTQSGYTDPLPRTWDSATGRPISTSPRPADPFPGATYSPDRSLAASSEKGGVVRVRDVATGKDAIRIETKEASIHRVVFNPDGRRLVIVGSSSIHFWDVTRKQSLAEVAYPFQGLAKIWFRKGGSRLVVSGTLPSKVETKPITENYGIAEWEFATGKVLKRLSLAEMTPLDLSPDGHSFLAGLQRPGIRDGRVELWEWDGDAKLRTLVTKVSENLDAKDVMMARYSPDGRTAAVGFRGSDVSVIEIATGTKRYQFDSRAAEVGPAVAFSYDGSRLATAAGRSVLVWDLSGASDRLPATEESAWDDLASPDAKKGWAAIRYFVARPGETVKRFKASLSVAVKHEEKTVVARIARLDAEAFEDREAAENWLVGVAEFVRPQLRTALAEKPSAEVRRRIRNVYDRAKLGHSLTGDRLRAVRAVEVLDRIASPAARDVLIALANGAPGAAVTDHARAALDGLETNRN